MALSDTYSSRYSIPAMKLFALLLCFATSPLVAAPNDSAENQILAAIQEPNVSIVHLWAPWCSNCQSELKSGGWAKMVKANPEVKFYFVSVWDNGDDGRAMLTRFELANLPNVTVLADPGARGADKIKQFAGMPVTWIPTTWVFKGGNLRYAMNYGEIHFDVLQQFITDSTAKW